MARDAKRQAMTSERLTVIKARMEAIPGSAFVKTQKELSQTFFDRNELVGAMEVMLAEVERLRAREAALQNFAYRVSQKADDEPDEPDPADVAEDERDRESQWLEEEDEFLSRYHPKTRDKRYYGIFQRSEELDRRGKPRWKRISHVIDDYYDALAQTKFLRQQTPEASLRVQRVQVIYHMRLPR